MGNVFRNLDYTVITNALLSIIPALICLTFHEYAHGLVANRLGDPTAKNMGRLTLNPIKHVDIIGLIMMLLFRFGWAKPVPVNMANFKNPKRGMAITALAGPVSNIILSAVFLVIYGALYAAAKDTAVWGTVLKFVYLAAYISLALAIFNLIPIPPLDGSKVLFALIPDSLYFKLMRVERYGFVILVIFMWTNAFSKTVGRFTEFCFDKLFYISEGVYRLLS
jgi:Zn-dependent protease